VLDEHALARPRRADEEEDLAVGDGEVDAREHMLRAEALADAAELDHGAP
jgi:hypothetical protein